MKTQLKLIFMIAIILLSGCNKEKQYSSETLKGVSLSPKSFSQDDFLSFFEIAKNTGNTVTWAGDWAELNDEKSAAYVVAELGKKYDYEPIIIVNIVKQSEKKLLRPLTEENINMYKESMLKFIKKYKPEYVGIGIEINMLNEFSPDDFNKFTQLFDEIYNSIKSISPETKVFTVFQLERMKGLQGGLFGGTNNPKEQTQWALLNKFPKADLIAFTTYPGLIYKSPSEIPADYYSEIKTHTVKPLAFTEIGWFRNGPKEWESSEEEQAEFIKIFFSLIEKPKITIWSFLYDANAPYPFDSMGLLAKDKETSLALEAWNSY